MASAGSSVTMWPHGMRAILLHGLLASSTSTASATEDLGNFVLYSTDATDGSICSPDVALFDCLALENGCASYTTLQSCLSVCDSDAMCRYATWGWDATDGGFYRCATFMACPSPSAYADGDPQLYYKPPPAAEEETSYEVAFVNTYCSGTRIFDCASEGSLLSTYEACHPEFYSLSNCQAECDSRTDCVFMLWGHDTGADFFRCTLFDSCSSGDWEYASGDVKVWRKPGHAILYELAFRDRTCNALHKLYDCVDETTCSTFSTPQACEMMCDLDPECRFYNWGWDDNGHWRCVTFSQCLESYAYDTGSPNVYKRPTAYDFQANSSFCGGSAIFDCMGTDCSEYDTVASCEEMCDSDPSCRYFSWGVDYGLDWRCATFASCGNSSVYDNGLVNTYVRARNVTDLPAGNSYCLQVITGSGANDGGNLAVLIDIGTGLVPIAKGDAYLVGSEVLDACLSAPVQRVQVRNPSDDAWAGLLQYSSDGGETYVSMACETCTRAANTARIVVDGNADEASLALTRCSDGDSCSFSPRAHYELAFSGRTCNTLHKLFDCVDLGDDAQAACSSFSTARTCEMKCDLDPECRFYNWGWDDNGHWRCVTFSQCLESYAYDTGSPNVYKRPTSYDLHTESLFCNGVAIFDCLNTDCSEYDTVATCEAMCDSDPSCQYFSWGVDNGLDWRCATFASCDTSSDYDNGLVNTYFRARNVTDAQAGNPYCLQVITGSSTDDGGSLAVSVDIGTGFIPIAEDDAYLLGSEVLDACLPSPVQRIQVSNPSNDAWAGLLQYSTDGGDAYMSMVCETCTTAGNTARIVVDGNADEAALASTQCSDGESCRFFPRAQYCLRILTGAEMGEDGFVEVTVLDEVTRVSGTFGLGDTVLAACFEQPVRQVHFKNPTSDGWAGSISYSEDSGMNWSALACSGFCVDGPGADHSKVLVVDSSSNTGSVGDAAVLCLDSCTFSLASAPTSTEAPESLPESPDTDGAARAGAPLVAAMSFFAIVSKAL